MDELELLAYTVEYCAKCNQELTEEEELNENDCGDMYCDICWESELRWQKAQAYNDSQK